MRVRAETSEYSGSLAINIGYANKDSSNPNLSHSKIHSALSKMEVTRVKQENYTGCLHSYWSGKCQFDGQRGHWSELSGGMQEGVKEVRERCVLVPGQPKPPPCRTGKNERIECFSFFSPFHRYSKKEWISKAHLQCSIQVIYKWSSLTTHDTRVWHIS